MSGKAKTNGIERDLVEGPEEFLADLKSGVTIESKYPCRRVVLNMEPQPHTVDAFKTKLDVISNTGCDD